MNKEKWTIFLTSNATKYRLLRTILQGIIAVIIANLDMLIGYLSIPSGIKAVVVALVMAILSPIMAELGAKKSNNTLALATVDEPTDSYYDDYFTEEELSQIRAELSEEEGGEADV